MKPFTSTHQPSHLAALFAEWVPLYIGQATMDDDEAEPFQQPLCDLERAINEHPITSLQDFFLHHATLTCFGSMCTDYSLQQRDVIHAAAIAAIKERNSLEALILEHMDSQAKLGVFLKQHDGDTQEFAAKAGELLPTLVLELIYAIAGHPATALETIVLKGRYLAAQHARGDLSPSEAFAFIKSFLHEQEGA